MRAARKLVREALVDEEQVGRLQIRRAARLAAAHRMDAHEQRVARARHDELFGRLVGRQAPKPVWIVPLSE